MRGSGQGFTLVELLVTIAIAGILVAAVVPQFQSMVRRSQLTSVTNDMIMAINFARSEAARVGGGVRMRTMDATDAANEWGPGWQVIGKDGVTVLQTFAGAAGGMKLNGTNGVVQVTFNSRGLPDRTMTVDVCNPGAGVRIAMTAVGRPATTELTVAGCP